MNLREQIEKEITDKVMTKLASEKVELALLSDFQKLANRFNQTGAQMEKVANEGSQVLDKIDEIEKQLVPLNKQKDKYLKEYNSLKSEVIGNFSRLEGEYNKIKKASKELGINYPKNIDESYRIANNYLKRAKR
jgi:septal ring factor EnvC (AmiA/AmiB activator)